MRTDCACGAESTRQVIIVRVGAKLMPEAQWLCDKCAEMVVGLPDER